jgi:hypothetical protein
MYNAAPVCVGVAHSGTDMSVLKIRLVRVWHWTCGGRRLGALAAIPCNHSDGEGRASRRKSTYTGVGVYLLSPWSC